MKNYQQNIQYIAHLKKLTQIMNSCRTSRDPFKDITPKNQHSIIKNIEFGKRKRNNLNNLNQKARFMDTLRGWNRQKQNIRLAMSIENNKGVIDLKKNEKDFEEHIKIMKMRRILHNKIENSLEFNIIEIVWRNMGKQQNEIFKIMDNENKIILQGTIQQISKQRLKLNRNKDNLMKIVGQKKCKFKIQKANIIPLIHKQKIVGTIIISFK